MLVVDVESTCWEKDSDRGPDEVSEIIEIGVTLINLSTLDIESTESILVKPINSSVSEFCTSLTTLTQSQVDEGITFQVACNLLRSKYVADQRTWGSWGDYDRNMFEKQCANLGIRYPFGIRHINLKNQFAVLRGLSKELGMDRALQSIGMELEGTHHRGSDDSKNIAKLFINTASIIRNYGNAKQKR